MGTAKSGKKIKVLEDDSPTKTQLTGKRKCTAPSTPRKPKAPTADLANDTLPAKKKTKGSPQKSPEKAEKRLKRFRDHPPTSYLEKLHRAQTQRMFVIERTPGIAEDGDTPEETIAMAGSTGNIYNVRICALPSCTCPDNRKGNQCKHIIYVLHNVLKAPDHLQYQLAFLSTELQTIFAAAPSPVASAKMSTEKGEGAEEDGAKRRPVEGDCPICFTAFEPEKEEIVYCKASCGNNIHADCFEQWAKSQAGKDVRCVYCRAKWQGDEEQVMRIVREKVKNGDNGGMVNEEGYLNVATDLGLSGARDYSSYHQPWVRRQGFGYY